VVKGKPYLLKSCYLLLGQLVPSWMSHMIGITSLTTVNFQAIPPTQWFKSSRQNQCLWCSSDPPWYIYWFVNVDPFFAIWRPWFFGVLNIELQIWMGNVQYTTSHQHKYFPSTLGHCEAFLHTFNMKICTHKTHLEVELLCSCSLTSKVVQCNAMRFTKNLMRCVHLKNTKTLWENRNSPWWNVKGHYVNVHSMSRLMVEPFLFHSL
jgi:hypothetical protein